MKIKDKIIKWLGGIPARDHDEFSLACEEFALKLTSAKEDIIVGRGGELANRLLSTEDVFVLGPATVRNVSVGQGQIMIAPWVRGASVVSCSAVAFSGPMGFKFRKS